MKSVKCYQYVTTRLCVIRFEFNVVQKNEHTYKKNNTSNRAIEILYVSTLYNLTYVLTTYKKKPIFFFFFIRYKLYFYLEYTWRYTIRVTDETECTIYIYDRNEKLNL